jgi:hypothetical protein
MDSGVLKLSYTHKFRTADLAERVGNVFLPTMVNLDGGQKNTQPTLAIGRNQPLENRERAKYDSTLSTLGDIK